MPIMVIYCVSSARQSMTDLFKSAFINSQLK